MRQIKNEDHTGFQFNLSEYARVLWRKKHMLLVPLFFCVVVAYVGAKFLAPVYESSVVLRIENEQVLNQEVARIIQQQARRRMLDAEVLATLRADLTGGNFLDLLSMSLGFHKDPRLIESAQRARETQTVTQDVSVQELVLRSLRNVLRKKIEVSRAGPGQFRVSYLDANPEACYIVADAMVKLYIEEQEKMKIVGLRKVSDFSDEQLAVYRERLDNSERLLEEFQRRTSKQILISNPVGDPNIGPAETLLRQLEIEVADGQNVVDGIKSRLMEYINFVPPENLIRGDPAVNNMAEELITQLEAELLAQLQGGGTTAHGGGGTALAIVQLQGDIQSRLNDLIRATYPDIEKDYRPLIDEYFYQVIRLRSHEEKLRKINVYVDAYREQVRMAPQLTSELQRLQADVNGDRILYETFLSAKSSNQINEAAQNTQLGSTMSIVEDATFPLKPVKPSKTKILMLAILFGLTIGGGGLILTEFTDSSFKTVDEVELHLELRVIGTIPRVEEGGVEWHGDNRKRRLAVWGATIIALTAVSIFAFYFYGKSTKEQWESIQVKRPGSVQLRGN
jgi:succinoglycan biosynthesis transport protein ExoP